MNWKSYLITLALCYLAIVVLVRGILWIYPEPRDQMILIDEPDAPAIAAQFTRQPPPPPRARPAPAPAAPKMRPPPRLKGAMDPFRRFEFDQRTMV